MASPEDVLEMPALGRPFQLGMLYDCYRDALLSEHFLLDPETRQKNTEQRPCSKIIKDKISSDTIAVKAAALGIKAPLLTSLLCGFFEVDGASKYLLNLRTSRHQDSIIYKHYATERIEQLDLSRLTREDFAPLPDLANCRPSHVVTAVWYGEQMFWDGDKDISALDTGNVNMHKVETPAQAKAASKADENERGQPPSLNLRLHNRFCLESSPVAFQHARKIQSSLGGEKSVPVKVRLFPLKNLKLLYFVGPFHEISAVRNTSIEDGFEALMEVDAECKDLLSSPAAKAFPEIRRKIQQFQDLCGHHKETFRKQLAEIVLSVREGVQEEEALEEVLKCRKQSPFRPHRLSELLDIKEITVVNSLLSVLKEVEVISLKRELDEKLLDPRADFVVAFMFTSLQPEEPSFSKCKASLSSLKQPGDSSEETRRSTGWFEDENITKRAAEAAKSFSAFARANLSRKRTRFIVASTTDPGNPGASIYLFESGHLKGTTFEPPSKPLPVQINDIAHDSVLLRLTPAQPRKGEVSSYQVEYKIVDQEDWVVWVTGGREERIRVTGLRPDTEYRFRYAAVSKPGLSESSDVSDSVRTLPARPSTTPAGADPASPVPVEGGQMGCMEEHNTSCAQGAGLMRHNRETKWRQDGRGNDTEKARGPQTAPSSPRPDGVAPAGPVPRKQTGSIASSLLSASRLSRKGSPSVYALPLENLVRNPKSPYLKYRIGEGGPQHHHKVVMLLGETGAGKTTLIDGMLNHILGVRWEDPFRFSVMQEAPKRSQAHSQTDSLTAYEINWDTRLQVPFSLTIIDTPGFTDTRGLEQDRMFLEQIREFFLTLDGIDHVDAVCLVVQASQPRLTQAQKYVFGSVLSIFGSDIKDNIQVLVTFADGKTPPVLEAIKADNVPCTKDSQGVPLHFPFNNSALFISNVQADEDMRAFNRMFWEMGARSMKSFFQSFNGLEPRSLSLSAHTLNERKELEALLQGLRPQIQRVLVKLEELTKTQRALEMHRRDMVASRNFEFKIVKIVPEKTDISGTGYGTTNCQQCLVTCHYPCPVQDNTEKWKCDVMDKPSGHCRVCSGKCAWNTHISQSHRWVNDVRKEKLSYRQLTEKYKKAHGKQMTPEGAFEWLRQECGKAEKNVEDLIWMSSGHFRRLQEMALKPNPMTEYADVLISSEEEEQQPGYEERICRLKSLRGKFSSSAPAGGY